MDDLMNAALPGMGAALGFAALHLCNDQLPGLLNQDWLGFLCAHLGAVAALLFLMPDSPASQPKAVVGGHVVAGVAGFLVVQSGMFGQYGEMAAVALTISGMSFLDVVHPPAGAYAWIFASEGMDMMGVLAPGMTGAAVLLAVQQVWMNNIKPMIEGKTKKM